MVFFNQKSLKLSVKFTPEIETICSLYVTDMTQFDKEAPSWDPRNSDLYLNNNLTPDNLYVGDSALIYLHATSFNVYDNFW